MKLFSIGGVALKLHPSLLVLLLYVVLVASVQFPAVVIRSGVNPLGISGTPILWGLAFAVGLLVSVAIHEFSHVAVARSMGIEVKGITLMMLGGVSEMGRIPEDTHYSEFKLAIIGPITSLVLAGVLTWSHSVAGPNNWSLFAYWLGSANFVLAIFNLLPAFPLDGGRALRSLLTARKGPVRATLISTRISKGLAWGLGALGLLSFNVLLLFIAFFIYVSAQSEMHQLNARGLLHGMRVGEVSTSALAISESAPLQEVALKMLNSRNTLLPVVSTQGLRLPALVSLDRVRNIPRHLWETTRVEDIMEKVPRILDAGEPVSQVMPEIMASPHQSLPVQANDQLIGVLRYASLSDILELRSLEEPTSTPENRAA